MAGVLLAGRRRPVIGERVVLVDQRRRADVMRLLGAEDQRGCGEALCWKDQHQQPSENHVETVHGRRILQSLAGRREAEIVVLGPGESTRGGGFPWPMRNEPRLHGCN